MADPSTADAAAPNSQQPPIVDRGKSLLNFLGGNESRIHEAPAPSNDADAGAPPAASAPAGADMHTFKVVLALSGEHLASVPLPAKPPPTVKQLKKQLEVMGHFGQLVKGDVPLELEEIFKDAEPDGETNLGLIRGSYIEVREAGMYNGIYEQHDTNEGRPAYTMIQSHNASAGSRYVYYSSKNTLPGWKFNTRYCPQRGEWDMLAPIGPGGPASAVKDDIPEGKYRLDNGGTETKPNAPRISKQLTRGLTQEDMAKLSRRAAVEEQENVDGTEPGGCFNGEAKVRMADGTSKQARDIHVGDLLMSASDGCDTTTVEACIVEARGIHQLVQLDDLLITPHHPVVQDGRWILPHDVQGARQVDADVELFNFITTNREAIHVEGFVATSIGTYCEGLHDIEQNAEHRIWGTDLIVRIYQQHPQWPNITASTADTIAAVELAKEGSRDSLWPIRENSVAAEKTGSKLQQDEPRRIDVVA